MVFDILKQVKESIISIANKKGITKENDIEILQGYLDEMLPVDNLGYSASNDNNKICIEESIIKKIIFYETEEEFDRLLDNCDNSVDYKRVSWIDERIASYILCVIELNQIGNFYEYENAIHNYQTAREYLLRIEKLEQRINSGIELFIKEYGDLYDAKYSDRDICKSITDNIGTEIESDKYLMQAISRFEEYWGSVLNSYVRKHASHNRLQYLISYIENLKEKDYIRNNSTILQRIILLQSEYISQYNK